MVRGGASQVYGVVNIGIDQSFATLFVINVAMNSGFL